MILNITGKHIEVTEAIKKHAEEKTSKLSRFYNSINQVEVILNGSRGGNISVEIIARAEHSKVFVVKEAGGEVYACIDLAVHKLEGQLRKKKEKERNNKRQGAG